MIRADRIALAALGLLAKAALGFLGLSLLIGWDTPPPRPATATAGDPEQTEMTVMLRVPEGALARHLNVVDASGRPLAILTHWRTGVTTVVSSRRGGTGVSYHLAEDGSARMRVAGTARVALIDAQPDGTSRVSHRIASSGFEDVPTTPFGDPADLDMLQRVPTQYHSVIEGPRGFRQGFGARVVDPRGG